MVMYHLIVFRVVREIDGDLLSFNKELRIRDPKDRDQILKALSDWADQDQERVINILFEGNVGSDLIEESARVI